MEIESDVEFSTLKRQAEAKLAELKDGISADDAKGIEREHDEILRKLEARKKLLREYEQISKMAPTYDAVPLVKRMIGANAEPADIRAAILDKLVDRQNRQGGPQGGSHNVGMGTRHMVGNTQTLDNPDFIRTSIEDALFARLSGSKPEGAATQFIGRSMSDLDNILAEAKGERRSWLDAKRDMGGMNTMSDFPNLLLGAGNRTLQARYEAASSPLLTLGRERQASDFRAISVLRLSQAPKLEKVGEGAEITHGSVAETKESFRVETFARIFSLSRQAIVNDDLDAFSDFLSAFGRAAAQSVTDQLVSLFLANSGDGADLEDGDPMFATTRGNKAGSGGNIDTTTLAAARLALRTIKDIDGVTPLAMTPSYLLVGPASETEAEIALTTIAANSTEGVNPFGGKLQILVEPRFTGTQWYVFAAPSQQTVFSYAYLGNKRGPQLATRDGWNVLGTEYRAVIDFGCGATDWRGGYLNVGA